jgi:hypothetical protein
MRETSRSRLARQTRFQKNCRSLAPSHTSFSPTANVSA